MRYLQGSNQYRRKKPFTHSVKFSVITILTFMILISILGLLTRKEALEKAWAEEPLLSPVVNYSISPSPTPTQRELQDIEIGKQADRFARPEIGKSASYLRYQLHCLAYMENGHHANNKCGDNGKACGMYQYHEGTFEGFRKIMMKEGLTHHMGSRLDDEDAIETTAWALSDERDNNWGPIVNLHACVNAK